MLVALALITAAQAQAEELARPALPAAGLATEGGPGMLWINPANQAYDPDLRWGLWSTTAIGADGAPPWSFAGTIGAGGLSVGAHRQTTEDGADWSFDYATSVRLPKRIAVGARIGWHLLPGGGNNYVGYDVGVSWRPLPWFGASAVAWNVNSPSPTHGARATSGIGLAFRPIGDAALLGIDGLHTFAHSGSDLDAHDVARATLRLRPVRGLYLRASADTDRTWTAGIELFFGQAGAGAYATPMGLDPATSPVGLTAFVGNDDPGEALFHAFERFPVVGMVDPPPYQPRGGLFGDQGQSWLAMIERLRRCEDDRSTKGIVIVLGGGGYSWAQAEEVVARVKALREADKRVVAYLYGPVNERDYLIAAAASDVWMHPSQNLGLDGISVELMHLRGLFDLVGVQPQFVRRAEYKSAVEQYTATEPSGPSLEQTEAWVGDLYGVLVDGVAAGRKKPADDVKALIDGGPYTAPEAMANGLVDALVYPDELEDRIEGKDLFLEFVHLEDLPEAHSAWEAPKKVAVLYVEGGIVDGSSSGGGLLSGASTGSATIVEQLEDAREDNQVKAVVIRVDSPGGSSFASEEIHRAIEKLKEEDKPVVVSMGGYAASGGYYVATNADAIWAEPTTITGSIGVYGGKFAIGGALSRFGVSSTQIWRGRNATIDSNTTPWDDVQRARMQAMVDQTYAEFKAHVAEGRGLTPDKVEEIARGHVWTGKRAAEIGLVDHLGGLDDAIRDARNRAGLGEGRNVQLVSYDDRGVLLEAVAPAQSERLGARLTTRALEALFPTLSADLRGLRQARRAVVPHDAWIAPLASDDVWLMDLDAIVVPE